MTVLVFLKRTGIFEFKQCSINDCICDWCVSAAKKVRFVIFSLTILNTFVSCIFRSCRWKVRFSGQMRKAILLYITLNIYFSRIRLLPYVPKLSIFQLHFGISLQEFSSMPIKLRILINFSLFDKFLPSPHKFKVSVRIIISLTRNNVLYSIFYDYFYSLKHMNGPYLLRFVRHNKICISYYIQCVAFSRNNQ